MPQKHPVNQKGLLDIEKIMGMLPHRYPFLLIDRVLEFTEQQSLVAIKNVTYNEAFFQGHFPALKVMPGVLVVEALAQAGGILLYKSIDEPEKKIVLLTKINNAKFRKPVVPGDQLRLEVTMLRLKSRVCHIRGKALVDGEIVVEGEVMASLMHLEEMNG